MYQHSRAHSWQGSYGSGEVVGLTGLSHVAIKGMRVTTATSEELGPCERSSQGSSRSTQDSRRLLVCIVLFSSLLF